MTTMGGARRRLWAVGTATLLVLPGVAGCDDGDREAAPPGSVSAPDDSPSAQCAMGRVDPLHEAFRPVTDGISMDFSITPEELLRQADGIAVVHLDQLHAENPVDLVPSAGVADRRHTLEATVLRPIQGTRAGERLTLAWGLLGADPTEVAAALPQSEVLLAWRDQDNTIPAPAGETPESTLVRDLMREGPWYELPADGCLPSVVTSAMWGGDDRTMAPWGGPSTVAEMEEALRAAR